MNLLDEIFGELKNKSDFRFNNFKIEKIDGISRIQDEAYLEKPTWLGGDTEFVCVFIDLDNSTLISNERHRKTVAKVYDYFTQNIVDVFNLPEIKAEYIDIKGDGVFGIYQGNEAVFKGFAAAVTFKTFFEKYIKVKFRNIIQEDLEVKIAINKDLILVKKIGKRGDYNEVWAGRLINDALKIASLKKIIEEKENTTKDLIIVPEKIYEKLEEKKEYTIFSCGHDENGNWMGKKNNLWKEFKDESDKSKYSEKVYYLGARWCIHCGNKFIKGILE